jgi:hypothetical protein
MKIMRASKYYGVGYNGLVFKTDSHVIDVFLTGKFIIGTFYVPGDIYGGTSHVLALGWLRVEITEDSDNQWEYM